MTMWPFEVRLDSRVCLTGVVDGDDTVWTLPIDDDTLDTIVLGPDFDDAGTEYEADSVSGGEVRLEGDWTDGPVAIGRKFLSHIELSRPYRRDQNGVADISARITVRRLDLSHERSGDYTTRSSQAWVADRFVYFVAPEGTVEDGSKRAWLNGNADDMTIFIDSSTSRPFTIAAVEWTVDYEPRRSGAS